jgi:hypothetical protein
LKWYQARSNDQRCALVQNRGVCQRNAHWYEDEVHQAVGIDQQLPLAAFDHLASIGAALSAWHTRVGNISALIIQKTWPKLSAQVSDRCPRLFFLRLLQM